jgi:hypothetical protein
MRTILVAAVFLASLMAASCNINVRKNSEGEEKKVDIETPFGGIHVNEGADVRDTGLPVYPGARPKPKSEGEDKSANVNISTSAFGLKVVAIEYETQDAPAKVAAYYRGQLKKFGNVLECHSRGGHSNYEENSDELKCEGDNQGNTIELKVGTKTNEHIVAIDPQGKGADFALVYVRTRGKEGAI